MSPPSRRRGLKTYIGKNSAQQKESPPSRRRGLKTNREKLMERVFLVASFAEAWIENRQAQEALEHRLSRLLRGGVD